ncbi:hypothetical protein ABEB36_012484 [Hypothenemus hampei]
MKNFPPLKFEHFQHEVHEGLLENNGHTVILKIIRGKRPRIQGGPLKGIYEFSQLHFHWGPNDTLGSENKINHQSFPLEMHVVMHNIAYGPHKAAKIYGGLTVLSFLTSISPNDNKNYDKLEEGLLEVQFVSSNKSIRNFGSLDNLTTVDRKHYFTYEGSLTTPPCSEVVTWIEFVNTVPLSKEQIKAFRSISTTGGRLTHNFRPVQPINDRFVYYNSGISHSKTTITVLYVILVFLLINT